MELDFENPTSKSNSDFENLAVNFNVRVTLMISLFLALCLMLPVFNVPYVPYISYVSYVSYASYASYVSYIS